MWLDKLLSWVFPSLSLKGTPWYQLWLAKERSEFLLLARVVYGIVGIAYIAHYVFFDRVMNLQPIEFWFRFRFSMLCLAWLTAAFYFVPSLYQAKFYKLP